MNDRRPFQLSRVALAVALCTFAATPAFAVNKDMVQLQTQVQDLQEAVAHLQQSNDERMGVLRDLVQQTADAVNKMSVTVENLQQQMRTEQDASSGKLDQVSGQVQSLNDSLDELKARFNSLQKELDSVQNQQQSINAALQNMAPAAGSAAGTAVPGGAPVVATPLAGEAAPDQSQAPATTQPADTGNGGSNIPPFPATQGPYANGPGQQAPAAVPAAPPVADLYKTALGDYEAAKYALSTSEFNQVTKAYPSDPLAGNSYYYLGEIDYRTGRYQAAVKDYDHVIEQFPGNPKIPPARLHKGMALLMLKQREAAIAEFRALIQRYPNSNEAVQARSKLNGMGVRPGYARNE